MPSKKKRCRNFPNHSSQSTNRDFETDTLTVPASQPSQAPPCTSSSACVTVASDTGLTAGPASFDVGGADADLQLLSSSCPPLLNCQREQDRDTAVDIAVDTAVSTVWDVVQDISHAFEVPNGSAGRAFVAQLSKYLLCFGNAGSFEGQALKVAMVFQQMLLQKPFRSSSTAYAKCLQRRLDTWQQGDLGQLLHECRTIQSQLEKQEKRQQSRESDSARHFASLVETGKLGSAFCQLSDGPSGGIHHLDDVIGDASVRDILKDKHPQAEPLHLDAVIPGQALAPPHPVLFESLTR